ncbi:VWA domain-containing protein [Pontixanthobacter gangjinensis]
MLTGLVFLFCIKWLNFKDMKENAEKAVRGFIFNKYDAPEVSPFDKLFEIFKEIITHTSGDLDEALDWMKQLDEEYKLTNEDYTLDDFVEDLKKKGYIREEIDQQGNGSMAITAKTERAIRQQALEQIFGKLKKGSSGNHRTNQIGRGDEHTGDFRTYQFGDSLSRISMTESLRNAQINHGIGEFNMSEDDLVVEETHYKSQMSTVLMIDISHSMILYGEDRITPAKKVAMALSELITTRYPKDTLDILVFGNDAWPISISELPYLKVGPYHTNTVAGLELAMDLLRRKRNTNKQIFMITDGKPSCVRERDGSYYKNSMGLDPYIVDKCYNMARQARKLRIPITTFMIAQDPYLTRFVQEFTMANQGKAFYTGLKGLGEMIFEDYEINRKKRIRG